MTHHKRPEIHARLPQEQFDILVSEAQEQGISLSELIRQIISGYLNAQQRCAGSDQINDSLQIFEFTENGINAVGCSLDETDLHSRAYPSLTETGEPEEALEW